MVGQLDFKSQKQNNYKNQSLTNLKHYKVPWTKHKNNVNGVNIRERSFKKFCGKKKAFQRK
jgi:hypothetical protein